MANRPIRLIVVGGILVTIIGLGTLVTYYTDWLWFQTLDYTSVFWTMRIAQFWSAALFGVLAAAVVGTNVLIAGRFTRHALQVGPSPFQGEDGEAMPGEQFLKSKWGYLIAAIVLVVIMSTLGASRWPLLLRFTHSQSFGVMDPIFGNDIGFYVFSLPFYEFVLNFLNGAVVVSVLAVGLIYVGGGGISIQEGIKVRPRPLGHLSGLGALYVLLMSGNYVVKMYGLLYSQNRVAFGAGYVDVNVNLWAYRFLAILFLGAAVMLAINVQRRSQRLLLMTAGVLVGGAIVVSSVPGAVIQKLIVEPSELAKEGPYIAYNIEATRAGFDLNRIEERPFEAAEELTRADIDGNSLTIGNIRVWDERPLIQTYQQVQEIRPYYVFHNVDVDRYTVDGKYRQVMLAGRELAIDRLPAQSQNWVNQRLVYTHGYGVAMSPVNDVTPEGLPEMLVKDIPPVADAGLEITRPEIYYGERTHAYVIVKTGTEEFDYPSEEPIYTTYQGTGGVPFNGLFNRLAFAIRNTDLNMLISSYMLDESRIMFRRTILDRAREIAPYLLYDHDPYLVIHEGRLVWVIDAYTATDMYPYSTRSGRSRTNYIRNSVKVLVNAYDGSVEFYQIDKKDPIINAYAEIFPGLYRPIEEMASELRGHLRYPKELFRFQVMLYQTYHMQDVQVYFNQEDLWQIPNEIYKDREQVMEPYYITMKLPGERRDEFLLMIPFTPARKDNMIAWLAARCDVENYGDLIVYLLPKDKLIYGPAQLEARIDQQTEISSQLTLWGQRGSEVIRGNLLAIPIGRSFMYVEPVYLQARQEPEPQAIPVEGEPQPRRRVRDETSTAIPELKQVIAIHGSQIVMRPTLDEALNALFGDAPRVRGDVAATSTGESEPSSAIGRTAAALADAAAEAFGSVKESLRKWDWASAGERMDALERTIGELRERLGEK